MLSITGTPTKIQKVAASLDDAMPTGAQASRCPTHGVNIPAGGACVLCAQAAAKGDKQDGWDD
jgi:hypothetical protein